MLRPGANPAIIIGLMANSPHLVCAHAILGRLISSWLEGSRLPLPPDLRLEVSLVDTPVEWHDPRESFTQPGVRIRAGQPGGTVRIETVEPMGWAEVDESAPAASVRFLPSALDHMDRLLATFMLITLIFCLRRRGLHHMHGASLLDPMGRGWLLLGDSHSGKSTTTAFLASRGWGIGTDDIAFLRGREGHVAVTGFRSRIALRPGAMAMLQPSGGTALVRRKKTGFWPEDLGAAWIQDIVPEIVVFTSLTGDGGPTRMKPLSSLKAVRQAMQWSIWIMYESTAAQEHLDLLRQLVTQASCYEAVLAPDLFSAPNALAEYLP